MRIMSGGRMSFASNSFLLLVLCLFSCSTYGLDNTEKSNSTVSTIIPSVSSATVVTPIANASNTNASIPASATPHQAKAIDQPDAKGPAVKGKVAKKDSVTPSIPSAETVSHDPDDALPTVHPPTESTPKTTTTSSSSSQSTTVTTPSTISTSTSKITTSKTTTSDNPNDLTSTAPSIPEKRHFDGPSFMGGIILTTGLLAIGFVAFKFYKSRFGQNYHTL